MVFEPKTWDDAEATERIDEFVEKSREMVGSEIDADRWHTEVNADQADVWCNGIGDVNPRWRPEGPGTEVHPTYIISVATPGMVFGASMQTPLENLIGSVEVRWSESLEVGDSNLTGTVTMDGVDDKERHGRRYVFLDGTGVFRRDGERVAEANTTLVRTRVDELMEDRDVYEYSEDEIREIKSLYDDELSRLEEVPPTPTDVAVGDELPTTIRGPLSVADMVCWNAGLGPSYGAHAVNYEERMEAADGTVLNPATCWVQKDSHQHEDFLLTEQRGMPLPFANGENMWALTAPLVTNWMGDEGFLERHAADLEKPYYYGDALWLDGEIVGIGDENERVEIEWDATNPLDEVVISGSSTVRL